MFFCEACRIKRDWPESLFRSKGLCECCGHIEVCYDVPSKYLPIPKDIKEDEE